MVSKNSYGMEAKPVAVLEPRQLNQTDEALLDVLQEGRATPSYLSDETGDEQTYISQRLRRLEEHGHVNKLARGLWELVDDPRDTTNAGDLEDADIVEWLEREATERWGDSWVLKLTRFADGSTSGIAVHNLGTTDDGLREQERLHVDEKTGDVYHERVLIDPEIEIEKDLLDGPKN